MWSDYKCSFAGTPSCPGACWNCKIMNRLSQKNMGIKMRIKAQVKSKCQMEGSHYCKEICTGNIDPKYCMKKYKFVIHKKCIHRRG